MITIKWNYKKMLKNIFTLILKTSLFFSFLVLISECEDFNIFIYSKVISILIFFTSAKILEKIS